MEDNNKILSARKEINIRFLHVLSGNWKNVAVHLDGHLFVEKLEYVYPLKSCNAARRRSSLIVRGFLYIQAFEVICIHSSYSDLTKCASQLLFLSWYQHQNSSVYISDGDEEAAKD